MLQLYEDITEAYYHGNDYFLGNVVIANSSQMEAYPHLIDGQQRLITLWIIVKVLHVLTGNNKLGKMLKIEDENDMPVSKIRSDVYEGLDQANIDTLLKWSKEDFNKSSRALSHLHGVLYNAVLSYRLFEEYFGRVNKEEQENFISYFINKVFLLPIELDGEDMDDATSRALTIFETINNRGLDLTDSDILKAKIYEMAKSKKEHHIFEKEWREFGRTCLEAGSSVNEAFRYYLRILRAIDHQTTSEPNMRNFFLTDSTSPLRVKMWRDIMIDLNEIGQVLSFISYLRSSSSKTALLFQILDSHSSKLPLSSLVVFLYQFRHLDDETKERQAIAFLESLILDCYRFDPSNDIKYRIFEINFMITSGLDWQINISTLPESFFEDRKRLRTGMVLLYHYLTEKNLSSEYMRTEFKVERIVQPKDSPYLDQNDWPKDSREKDMQDMANYTITDFPKSNKILIDRSSSFNSSRLTSVSEILNGNDFYEYRDFIFRKDKMRKVLSEFFLQK